MFAKGVSLSSERDQTHHDVTLTDDDTNLILTDSANRVIQGNVAMQVMQTGDQCKLCHLVAQFATGANGASWWSNLQSV